MNDIRHRPSLRSLTFVCVVLQSCSAVNAAAPQFLRDVAPILQRRCAGCHGEKKTEGEYRLHTFESLLKAGASGTTAVVPGQPGKSELLTRLLETDASTRMPQQDDPLSKQQVSVIRDWIAAGAKFDGRDAKQSWNAQLPPRNHPSAPKSYRVPVPVFAVAFSPDGTQLATGGYHEITLWHPKTGKLLRRLDRLPQRIQCIQWNSDGTQLLIGGGSPGEYGEISLVDLKSGQRTRVLGTFEDIVLGVTFSPKGQTAAAVSADRFTRVYDVKTGKQRWQARIHSDWVTAVAFSPDGKFVATSSKDTTVKVHDADTGRLFTTYNGHRRQYGSHTGLFGIYSVMFDRESGSAFSAGEGKAVRIWNPVKANQENGTAGDMEARFAKSGHTRYVDHGQSRTVFALAIAGKNLFTASGDGTVGRFDIPTGKPVRSFDGQKDWVYALDVHAKSGCLAAGAFDGRVCVWNIETGSLITTFLAIPTQ